MSLRFVFSDRVRMTPSANPATEAMKSKMAVRPGDDRKYYVRFHRLRRSGLRGLLPKRLRLERCSTFAIRKSDSNTLRTVLEKLVDCLES
jgi:hypothetical protein